MAITVLDASVLNINIVISTYMNAYVKSIRLCRCLKYQHSNNITRFQCMVTTVSDLKTNLTVMQSIHQRAHGPDGISKQ
jgi:hypothetical protein